MLKRLFSLALVLTISATTTIAFASEHVPSATVLCYHVVESPHDTMFAIDRSVFLQQVQYLVSTGYNIIPLSMLSDYVSGKRKELPDRAVVLTVDDGWRCTYTEIYPVLKRFHVPFTIFIYPKFVGQSAYALTWKQVREMSENGVDVESHTNSHPFLTSRRHRDLQPAEYTRFLRDELVSSKQTLEKETGKPVRFLAYPYGDYDTAVATATASSGYEAGLTCDYGTVKKGSNPFRMRRVMVVADTSFASFRQRLGSAPLSIAGQNPRPGRQFDTTQPVVSARIPDYASIDPASVGMTLLGAGKAPSFFDARTGTVSMVLHDDLRGNQQRAVVWARDLKTGKRLEASWSFYLNAPIPGPIPQPFVIPPDLVGDPFPEGTAGVSLPSFVIEPRTTNAPETRPSDVPPAALQPPALSNRRSRS
jgi:peptidoglycan/xylan/chitin deacetylase (PgdA/CDA1 family)